MPSLSAFTSKDRSLFDGLPEQRRPCLDAVWYVERLSTAGTRPGYFSRVVNAIMVDRYFDEIADLFCDTVRPFDTLDADVVAEARVDFLAELCRGSFDDGYSLASHLERRCLISPDAETVDRLDGFLSSRYRAHRDLVRLWVRHHKIAVPYAVGDQVAYVRREGRDMTPIIRPAVIDGVDGDDATCTVRVPSLGHMAEGSGLTGPIGFILPVEKIQSSDLLDSPPAGMELHVCARIADPA